LLAYSQIAFTKTEEVTMQNKTFKNFITWLLIASPLWWTSGCYAAREYTRLQDVPIPPIEVVTKGNVVYSFERGWRHDGSGGISGKVRSGGYMKLPGNSIKSFTPEKGNEIAIVTRDSKTYFVSQWSVDSSGSLYGIGGRANPLFMMGDTWQPNHFDEMDLRFPADSIKTVAASEFSTPLTILGVSAIVGVIAASGVWIYALAQLHELGFF
jgi:hypothetical protein